MRGLGSEIDLVHVPGAPNQRLDARTQFRIGQGKLYAMTFADFIAAWLSCAYLAISRWTVP